MKSITIAQRLTLAFGLLGLILVLATAFAGYLIYGLNDELRALSERRLPNAVMAGKFTASVLQSARHTRNMLILDDRNKVLAEVEATRQTIKDRSEYLAYLDAHTKSPATRAQLEQVKLARAAYLPLEESYLDLVSQQKMAEAKLLLLDHMRPGQVAYIGALEKLAEVIGRVAEDSAKAAVASAQTGLYWLIATALLAIVAAVAIAWTVTRSIVRPLQSAVAVSEQIASGNLRNVITVDGNDEVGMLMHALDGMQTSLATLVRGIQSNAGNLTQASGELASTAQQVSEASNDQSEAAASMAAAVQEMTVSVSHIAESAQLATSKTAQSTELSTQGRSVVASAGAGMTAVADDLRRSAEQVRLLQTQSHEISSIADVIKTIAAQTNLLALNAAIEAARAGDAGRGFAVVADAVRELAERTGQSTAEIASTIAKIQGSTEQIVGDMNASVARADAGLALSQQAGSVINDLTGSAAEVLDAVQEISSTLKEQSQASNDIARHVERIAQMAQENSVAVDQTRASAKTLQQLAAALQASVTRFAV
jgi:methyl-accepting chemotaxis protein